MLRKRLWRKRPQKQSLENKGNGTVRGLHDDHQVQEDHRNVQEVGAIIVKKIATDPVLIAS